jgi:hypothetical protein
MRGARSIASRVKPRVNGSSPSENQSLTTSAATIQRTITALSRSGCAALPFRPA